MPPRTRRKAPETDSENRHVVLVDMLTYKVKGRRAGTFTGQRARKGSLVTLDPELNDIDYLVALKAVGPDDGTRYKRTTAKVLAEAAGGREDPVRAPENLFEVPDSEDVTAETGEDQDDEDEDADESPDGSTPADDE